MNRTLKIRVIGLDGTTKVHILPRLSVAERDEIETNIELRP